MSDPTIADIVVERLAAYLQGISPADPMENQRYRRLAARVLAQHPPLKGMLKESPNDTLPALRAALEQVAHTDTEAYKILQALSRALAPLIQPRIRPTADPLAERPPVMSLQLTLREGDALEVRTVDSPAGEAFAYSRLPYSAAELPVVLRALQGLPLDQVAHTEAHVRTLKHHGLIAPNRIAPDIHARVGQQLYSALFAGQNGHLLRTALSALRQGQAASLQLRFDNEEAHVARFPWELIHDGREHLVASGQLTLIRYLTCPKPRPTLRLEQPLRVLYIQARPGDIEPLPLFDEQEIVRRQIAAARVGQLDLLTPPTYQELLLRLPAGLHQVIHFDGHGSYDRRCPACGSRNLPHHIVCQNRICGADLRSCPPQGYLAFEDETGVRVTHWLSSEELGALFAGTRAQLMVLSACETGMVRGSSMTGGLAPALIQAGVPAVIAMQLPIVAEHAERFIAPLYQALLRGEPPEQAMRWARKALIPAGVWFIPVLYMRTR